MTTMEQRAAELRPQLGVPRPGEAPNAPDRPSRPFHDGWFVERPAPRWIGLIRRVDYDPVTRIRRGVLLAEMVLDRVLRDQSRASRRFVAAFAAMAAARYADDPALVLAIACREAGGLPFSGSSTEYHSYFQGGGDNVWAARRRLQLPADVQRRMRQAPAISNERGRPAAPALIQGRDQMVTYIGLVVRAQESLENQMARAFGSDGLQAQTRLLEATRATRRAWTQLSFGRGGGGGLLHALARARQLGGDLECIFTDPELLREMDSVKRARVTAGDAALIEEFVLPTLGVRPRSQ